MDLVEIGCGSIEFLGLVLDRDKWRALVDVVMDMLVS
jgi:hypothetical protein